MPYKMSIKVNYKHRRQGINCTTQQRSAPVFAQPKSEFIEMKEHCKMQILKWQSELEVYLQISIAAFCHSTQEFIMFTQ